MQPNKFNPLNDYDTHLTKPIDVFESPYISQSTPTTSENVKGGGALQNLGITDSGRIVPFNSEWLSLDVDKNGINDVPYLPSQQTYSYRPRNLENPLTVGDKIRIDGGALYHYIQSVDLSNNEIQVVGNTPLGISVSSFEYSKLPAPDGFPDGFSFPTEHPDPTATDYTVGGGNRSQFTINGSIVSVSVNVDVTIGSGGLSEVYFTLPFLIASTSGIRSANAVVDKGGTREMGFVSLAVFSGTGAYVVKIEQLDGGNFATGLTYTIDYSLDYAISK